MGITFECSSAASSSCWVLTSTHSRQGPSRPQWYPRGTVRAMNAYLSACAMYRDHAGYLVEWIEFHRLVGFDRLVLYNNLSTDDHREVSIHTSATARSSSRLAAAIRAHRWSPARDPARLRPLPGNSARAGALDRIPRHRRVPVHSNRRAGLGCAEGVRAVACARCQPRGVRHVRPPHQAIGLRDRKLPAQDQIPAGLHFADQVRRGPDPRHPRGKHPSLSSERGRRERAKQPVEGGSGRRTWASFERLRINHYGPSPNRSCRRSWSCGNRSAMRGRSTQVRGRSKEPASSTRRSRYASPPCARRWIAPPQMRRARRIAADLLSSSVARFTAMAVDLICLAAGRLAARVAERRNGRSAQK